MNIQKMISMSSEVNMAEKMSDEDLAKLGELVVRTTKKDDSTREAAGWTDKNKEAMEIAMQVVEAKNYPWPGASNVKYPGITIAALQFHARIVPAIMNGNNIAKGKVTGRDDSGEKARQAKRVADHMNYQLIEEMDGWEDEMDGMLIAFPIEGCEFKKTYFSPELQTNVSEWVRPDDLIVSYFTKSFKKCPRITHRLRLYPQEIKERQMSGTWLDVDLDLDPQEIEEEVLQEFYEQHLLWDMDGDGYKEPWCVTVSVKSQKVVRVKADFSPREILVKVGERVRRADDVDAELLKSAKVVKIEPIEYFTKYELIPSPDGGFYGMGIGHLAKSLNESVSSIINQVIDAGTLANIRGGFISDGVTINGKRGPIKWKQGEYKRVKVPQGKSLRESIVDHDFGGPSVALFNILGLLMQVQKDMQGVQDIHTGGKDTQETATTTVVRVEEGQRVFNGVFKRTYRALGKELKKLYRLNSIYLEPESYFRVLDGDEVQKIGLRDYQNDGTDVQPVADPSMSNTAQRIVKAEALMALRGDPSINQDEVTRRYLDAIDIPNAEALIIPAEQRQPPPDPRLMEAQLKVERGALEKMKLLAEIRTEMTVAIKNTADAESKEAGTNLAQYRLELDVIDRKIQALTGEVNGNGKQAGNAELEEGAGGPGGNETLGAEEAGNLG